MINLAFEVYNLPVLNLWSSLLSNPKSGELLLLFVIQTCSLIVFSVLTLTFNPLITPNQIVSLLQFFGLSW